MTLGERMVNYRAEHGISQTEMAELLGTNLNMIFRCERGDKLHKVNAIRFTKKLDELEGKEC